MFLSQLENLHKVDLKKMKQGDTADAEEFASAIGLAGTSLNESEIDISEEDSN